MLDFVDDLDLFLTDFSITGTVGGVTLQAIFDRRGVDDFGIAGEAPQALVKAADIVGATVGTLASFDGTDYAIMALTADGHGLVTLALQETS